MSLTGTSQVASGFWLGLQSVFGLPQDHKGLRYRNNGQLKGKVGNGVETGVRIEI